MPCQLLFCSKVLNRGVLLHPISNCSVLQVLDLGVSWTSEWCYTLAATILFYRSWTWEWCYTLATTVLFYRSLDLVVVLHPGSYYSVLQVLDFGVGATPWQLLLCFTGAGPGSGATPWQLLFCSTGPGPGNGATPWQLLFCSTGLGPGSNPTP
jgi:hypothetical protein